MISLLNAMIFRPMTSIVFEIHPYSYGLLLLCSHHSLTIVYIIILNHVHVHINHVGLCFHFALHVLITYLNVTFIKTCVYACTTSEPQIDYYMFVLDCSLVLIRCTSIT